MQLLMGMTVSLAIVGIAWVLIYFCLKTMKNQSLEQIQQLWLVNS
jgi:hypothetical protein